MKKKTRAFLLALLATLDLYALDIVMLRNINSTLAYDTTNETTNDTAIEQYKNLEKQLYTHPEELLNEEQMKIMNEKLKYINDELDKGGYEGIEEIIAAHSIISEFVDYDFDAVESKGNYLTEEQIKDKNQDQLFELVFDGSYADGLINGKAVCKGISDIMKMVLEKRNNEIKIKNIWGTVYKSSEFTKENIDGYHGWLLIEVDGKWYHFNPVYDSNGNISSLDSYFLSDEDFKKSYGDNIEWYSNHLIGETYPEAKETMPRLQVLAAAWDVAKTQNKLNSDDFNVAKMGTSINFKTNKDKELMKNILGDNDYTIDDIANLVELSIDDSNIELLNYLSPFENLKSIEVCTKDKCFDYTPLDKLNRKLDLYIINYDEKGNKYLKEMKEIGTYENDITDIDNIYGGITVKDILTGVNNDMGLSEQEEAYIRYLLVDYNTTITKEFLSEIKEVNIVLDEYNHDVAVKALEMLKYFPNLNSVEIDNDTQADIFKVKGIKEVTQSIVYGGSLSNIDFKKLNRKIYIKPSSITILMYDKELANKILNNPNIVTYDDRIQGEKFVDVTIEEAINESKKIQEIKGMYNSYAEELINEKLGEENNYDPNYIEELCNNAKDELSVFSENLDFEDEYLEMKTIGSVKKSWQEFASRVIQIAIDNALLKNGIMFIDGAEIEDVSKNEDNDIIIEYKTGYVQMFPDLSSNLNGDLQTHYVLTDGWQEKVDKILDCNNEDIDEIIVD